MYGIISRFIENDYRIKTNMFIFKFDMKGDIINFCVKHNLPINNIYYNGIVEIFLLWLEEIIMKKTIIKLKIIFIVYDKYIY